MKYVDKISNTPIQSFILVGDNGELITFILRYLPSQRVWTLDIGYLTTTIAGIQLGVSPNILRSYSNILPFGFAVTSQNGLDPMFINDFSTGRIKIYLLNSADVALIESELGT